MTAHAQTILAIVGSTLAICGVIWRASKSKLDPVLDMIKELRGEEGDDRKGIAARPGILERQTASERHAAELAAQLAAAIAAVAEVKAQVTHNGGSSLKDIAAKTYEAVTNASAAQAAHALSQETRA